MSVGRNVAAGIRYVRRLSKQECQRRASELLEKVGLAEKFDSFPEQLSGGQQQRVAIARALVNQPSLLLADEPTGNLDSKTSLEVMQIFQDLRERRGITIVLITHEPDIAAFGTRIIQVRDGHIVSDRANRPRVAVDATPVHEAHEEAAVSATA
jgi:putative ABC transport system ATP-binding protein